MISYSIISFRVGWLNVLANHVTLYASNLLISVDVAFPFIGAAEAAFVGELLVFSIGPFDTR